MKWAVYLEILKIRAAHEERQRNKHRETHAAIETERAHCAASILLI